MKVLIAGESWVTYSVHVKGFDTFETSSYEEGVGWLRDALEKGGAEVTYMPNHEAHNRFPSSALELKEYDVVMLSDIGSNTLLLSPTTFSRSELRSNPLTAINEYVHEGGALVMIGGYMSFQGIEAKAKYHDTAVEDVLPVIVSEFDDRVEKPEGIRPRVSYHDHPVLEGLPKEWPHILGYNRIKAREQATVLVKCGDDPIVSLQEFGKGRSMAFATDCGPHWAPPDFVNWDGYSKFWNQALKWLSRDY